MPSVPCRRYRRSQVRREARRAGNTSEPLAVMATGAPPGPVLLEPLALLATRDKANRCGNMRHSSSVGFVWAGSAVDGALQEPPAIPPGLDDDVWSRAAADDDLTGTGGSASDDDDDAARTLTADADRIGIPPLLGLLPVPATVLASLFATREEI